MRAKTKWLQNLAAFAIFAALILYVLLYTTDHPRYHLILDEKTILPALLNHLSGIIKGTALLKIVSVPEISYVLTVISSKNWASVEGYLVMWMMYLIITIPLYVLAQLTGRRLENGN